MEIRLNYICIGGWAAEAQWVSLVGAALSAYAVYKTKIVQLKVHMKI